jgi:hypothetical protein
MTKKKNLALAAIPETAVLLIPTQVSPFDFVAVQIGASMR